MKITRRFTKANADVYASVQWTTRSSKITNPDGSTVFEMKNAQVPAGWSQLATDIMVSKYFRKAGVPQTDDKGAVLKDDQGKVVTGPEQSAKQVVHRLAGCWRHWGEQHNYFDTPADAQAFYDEVAYMLLTQMCAPNSPQWFNTGLNFAYGITGPAQGHWVVNPKTGEPELADDAYTHPQPHACFIQSVNDDLVNEGGIMELWLREARLFKYGSGTGTNFSKLRGEEEPLSGGGRSSGLMSWLRIGDRAAGAIKSGGTTRRAAKMVCLDLDHPDVEHFIDWKVREELKVAALVAGAKLLSKEQQETAAKMGLKLDYDFNGEAYATVSGQNSNNSIRISDDFFNKLDVDGDWELKSRTNGKITKKVKARALWDKIGYAAWRCADPGVQFDTTINEWHTCPASGRINASNPCSEYMFLDNTACNLASLNLLKFYDSQTRQFDVQGMIHGVELWTIVLEISVLMAAFPSREIAKLSYDYRTLGLGYANIGAMLMQAGIPYDSEEARAICGALTAMLTGGSYATSARMAAELGPFPGYAANKEAMLRVIRNHRRAAYGVSRDSKIAAKHELGDYENLQIKPVPIEAKYLENPNRTIGSISNSADLLHHARVAWDVALREGEKHGYRNAQTTVIAPTGTIGLLMDCDTTGVEPDFALVKFKKLAGGGYFKIINQSVKPALEALGYSEAQQNDIMTYVLGTGHLGVALPARDGSAATNDAQTFAQFLLQKGFTQAELDKATKGIAGAMELGFVFNTYGLGAECIKRLGLENKSDILRAIGLTKKQIASLNETICGTGTIEGAPKLKLEHYSVFDCANKCGKKGVRYIEPQGHIRMMAASQPFITGAISKTINLPNDATIEDIKASYRLSWELGLKANALYRDGCKLSQPLNAKSDSDEEVEDIEALEEAREEVAAQVASAGRIISTTPLHSPQSAKAVEPAAPNQVTPVPAPVERIIERIIERPLRRRLTDTRRSVTHKFNVAGHEGYLTVGLYDDGIPGELFITMAKEGSTVGGLMDSLGTAISIALQYGVPLESLVNKFTHQRFEPAGMTHNPDVPFAKSLVDYIFRWMGMEFIPGYRAANAPRRASKTETPSEDSRSTARAKAEAVAHGTQDHSHDHAHAAAPDHGIFGSPIIPDTLGDRLAPMSTVDAARRNVATPAPVSALSAAVGSSAALASSMREMQADSPACDVCGTITVRSGTCYKCLNCGNSMGCS